jgi:hypothetical protein
MATAAELTHWRDFWGDPADRPNPYGSLDDIYTEGYHRGEDVSNEGRPEFVPALRAGEIIDWGSSALIGYWVAVKPDVTLFDREERDIYCHMSLNGMRRGGRVERAELLGKTAGWGEFAGSAWRGCHLHFVIAENSHGGFNTRVIDYDPRPVIRAALAGKLDRPAPAGTGTPLPTPIERTEPEEVPGDEEDDDMPIILMNADTDEWSLLDPDVGLDLAPMRLGVRNACRSERTAKGVVNTYRGVIATTDPDIGKAWSRSYCRRFDNVPQKRHDADYKAAQVEASRLSAEKHRKVA